MKNYNAFIYLKRSNFDIFNVTFSNIELGKNSFILQRNNKDDNYHIIIINAIFYGISGSQIFFDGENLYEIKITGLFLSKSDICNFFNFNILKKFIIFKLSLFNQIQKNLIK